MTDFRPPALTAVVPSARLLARAMSQRAQPCPPPRHVARIDRWPERPAPGGPAHSGRPTDPPSPLRIRFAVSPFPSVRVPIVRLPAAEPLWPLWPHWSSLRRRAAAHCRFGTVFRRHVLEGGALCGPARRRRRVHKNHQVRRLREPSLRPKPLETSVGRYIKAVAWQSFVKDSPWSPPHACWLLTAA